MPQVLRAVALVAILRQGAERHGKSLPHVNVLTTSEVAG
jgi:hypothetical protein